mmetsp:Transcript_12586/g.41245  ORF Transcript_12586/g.41245 Transcript_12586/m.41245 type:complete len:200 (+) Transcript_12586:226-825(+)
MMDARSEEVSPSSTPVASSSIASSEMSCGGGTGASSTLVEMVKPSGGESNVTPTCTTCSFSIERRRSSAGLPGKPSASSRGLDEMSATRPSVAAASSTGWFASTWSRISCSAGTRTEKKYIAGSMRSPPAIPAVATCWPSPSSGRSMVTRLRSPDLSLVTASGCECTVKCIRSVACERETDRRESKRGCVKASSTTRRW